MTKPFHLDETDVDKYIEIKKTTGLPDAVIAETYFFVSAPTLARWKRKYNVKVKRFTPKAYLDLRKKGYTDKDICIKWDITASGLYQWKRRENLPEELFSYGRYVKKGIDYDELSRQTIS